MSKEAVKKELKQLKKEGNAPDWMTWMGYAMLKESYLQGVTPRERYRCIAKKAASYLPEDNKKWENKFFNLFWNNYLAASTPVMGNLGTDRGLAVSCSASYVADSLEDISYTGYELEVLSKYAFGTAAFLDIRGGYESISTGGKTNPTSDWVKKYWYSQNWVSQGGLRRGSTAIYLDFWQKDLMEVLPMMEQLEKLHLGVICDDSVKEALEKNDPEAMRRYLTILNWRARKGKPYIIFVDNARRQDPPCYKEHGLSTKQSNLCVHPDTEVLTKNGFEIISKLENKNVEVWNGEEWSETKVQKTGVDQELVEITFSNGETLKCTPYHKFRVQVGYDRGTGKNKLQILEKRAHELERKDKLIKFDLPIVEFEDTVKDPYTQGFFSGDGCKYNGKNHIDLYCEKKDLLPFLSYDENRSMNESSGKLRIFIDNSFDKFYVPSKTTISTRLKWLAGMLDSDGTIAKNGSNKSLQIGSVKKEFLIEIKRMLMTLGVESKVTLNKESGQTLLPDGKGGSKYYDTQAIYRLLVNSAGLEKLKELGLECNRLDLDVDIKPNRDATHFVKIDSVEKLEEKSDTYCFTEPKRNLGIFNGVIAGNCSEIMLHTDSEHTLACVLSSMVGSNFDEWKDTDAVFNAIVFLDCVNQDLIERGSNVKGLERVVKSAVKSRALGLGLLGFHTYLQDKDIPFDSFEARMVNGTMFKHIKDEAVRATEFLAKWLGEPEWLKGYGRRNTHLLAIAPNTSSAFIAGSVSQGIEPTVANVYSQRLAKVGAVERINPALLKRLKERGYYTEDVIDSISFNKGSVQHLDDKILSEKEKEVFKTAYELNQKVLIDLAEHRQQWICQGQSLNLFFDANEGEEWIHEVHKYAFSQNNLKALYYTRMQPGITADKDDTCKSCEG